MSVTIAAVDALPYEREIKQLFLEHERPEFPDFFDRTYPAAAAQGARSWVGRDGTGRVVMHIACVPRRFRFGTRDLVAGLLVNLMVAAEHRTFFPALTLVRRLITDARQDGGIDFLYADPNEGSAALLRGTRFTAVDRLQRFVLPLADERLLLDWAIRLSHRARRIRHRAPRGMVVTRRPARATPRVVFSPPSGDGQHLSAYHDSALYVSRIKGYPAEGDWWFTAHRAGVTGPPDGALLIRERDESGMAVLHTVRRSPALPLAAFLPPVVADLRRRGCTRLQVMALADSELAGALRACGFIPRSETVTLFALPLSPLGAECVQAVRCWEVTALECDR